MRFIILAALFACAMGASLPRIPMGMILDAQAPKWDPNEERIVGGEEVVPNSLRFQARMEGTTAGALRCGGSVYNEWTIITAAHCVDGISTGAYRIVAGDHTAGNSNDGTEQVRSIEAYISNSAYVSSTFENDLALIILTSPLDLSVPEVKGINLPGDEWAKMDVPEGTNVTISGWGTTSSGGSISTVLRAVSAPVVSDVECNRTISYDGQIRASMLCAGLPEGGVDSCQGDSGGPLFTCTDESKTDCTQWGVVSWGRGCALANYPGVYTETTYYLDWIKNNAKTSA